jgi:uncharacterized DUF497 family protein
MKYIDWDKAKNVSLLSERGVSFEMVLTCIEEGSVLAKIKHPNQKKYPHQHMYIVEIDEYVYAVPYVEDEEKIFLKTIIPNRKLTRLYLQKHHE